MIATMPTQDRSHDKLTPAIVASRVKAHDNLMATASDLWGEIRAVIRTEHWKWIRSSSKKDDQEYLDKLTQIEVNKIKRQIGSYLASLFVREMEAEFRLDPTADGDASKAKLVTNHLMRRAGLKGRILQCSRMTLTYDYCGIKVGHDPADGRPALDRVWFRAIPPWDLLLDDDVTDEDEARYVGTFVRVDIEDFKRDYPDVPVEGLTLYERPDPLRNNATTPASRAGIETSKPGSVQDEARFVRTLELCNLVDSWEDPHSGLRLQGRLEIYVVGTGGPMREPIWTGPLPYSIPGHPPLPNVFPLIFDADAEAPLRGIGMARMLMPQQRALNAWRSWQADKAQRDNPFWFARKGTLSNDNKAIIERGRTNSVVEIDDPDNNVDLRQVMVAVQPTQISSDQYRAIADTERDLEMLPQISPAALTQVTEATAFEIGIVERHSESEFGRHAEARDEWLSRVLRVALAAVAAAMRIGGGVGADVEAEVDQGTGVHELSRDIQEGASPDARTDTPKGGAGTVDQPGGTEAKAAPGAPVHPEPKTTSHSPAVDALLAALPAFAIAKPAAQSAADTIRAVPESMWIEGDDGQMVEIKPEDIEAYWHITFSESGRTPAKDLEQKQALRATQETYMALWAVVRGVDKAAAVLARAQMRATARLFNLPRELHVEELEAELKRQEEAAAKPPRTKRPRKAHGQATPPPSVAAPAPAPAAAAAQAAPNADAAAILDAAAQRAQQDPVAVAKYLIEQGAELPELQQAVSLPPEQALPLVLAAIETMRTAATAGGTTP